MKAASIKVILIWTVFFALTGYPSKIESYFFPVIEDVQFVIEPSADQSYTLVSLRFNKIRGECRPEPVKFYDISTINGKYIKEYVDSLYIGESRVRIAGPQYSGPWKLSIPMDKVHTLQIDLQHTCHIGYMTTSSFTSK